MSTVLYTVVDFLMKSRTGRIEFFALIDLKFKFTIDLIHNQFDELKLFDVPKLLSFYCCSIRCDCANFCCVRDQQN